MRGWGTALLAALLACTLGAARAQSLESVLEPGPLIAGHLKAEADCANCHVRFDRAGQDRLCVACHKEVGRDLREKTGLHGRHKPQACRSCHTDHRGREMQITGFDPKAFDHGQTNYPLAGRHATLECKACHAAGKKFRQAPSDCLACHRKDDKHQGTLGKACAGCHVERGWKETVFDHEKTRFPLSGKHVQAKCDKCHTTKVYKDAPTECIGCHRKDDKHKARYGEKCDTCHATRGWAGVTFHHDTDTRYALRGKHREVKCDSCHTGLLYKDKLAAACQACHRKDDKHQGSLGTECAACHTERGWKEVSRFDHERSRFPLRGAHLKPPCQACHTTLRYTETPSQCEACHRKDDKHEGTLGTACADCHDDRDWKARRFEHARTRFALREGHAVPPLKCADCHRDARSFKSTALECVSCHRKEDRHEAQLGTRCEGCHVVRGWRGTRFDHAGARFALSGAHVKVECKSCHLTLRYRDAARECIGCHRKDDKHQARLGERCESCHNVRDWRLWAFDHERRTNYRLEPGHTRVACQACHTQPAPAGKPAAALGRDCLGCHRRDDVHDGAFGARCEQCHSASRWKQVSPRPRVSARSPDLRVSSVARGDRGWE